MCYKYNHLGLIQLCCASGGRLATIYRFSQTGYRIVADGADDDDGCNGAW